MVLWESVRTVKGLMRDLCVPLGPGRGVARRGVFDTPEVCRRSPTSPLISLLSVVRSLSYKSVSGPSAP